MVDRHTWAASVVAAEAGEHLLEIGCGAGHAAQLVLRDLGPTGSLCAIDRSAVGVRQTSARCAREVAEGRLRVEQLNLAELNVPAGSFDGAWAMNVNLFWRSDPAAALGVLHQALRPGGRLLLLWDLGPTAVGKLEPVGAHLVAAGFIAVEQAATDDGIVVSARTPSG